MHPLTTPPGRGGPARASAARGAWWRRVAAFATLAPLALFALAAAAPAGKTSGGAPEPATASGPTLFVPPRTDSVELSDPVPLTVPGRPSITDTLDTLVRRRAADVFAEARAYEDQGLDATAIISYRNALRIDPHLRDANYRMGRLFLRSDQLKAALDCFGKEIEYHPDHLDAQREFGMTLARSGQGEMAVAHLDRLVKQHPNDGSLWHALGYAYQAAGRPNDAERAMRKAIALPPDDAEEHRDLGAVLAGVGRDREARAEYQKALALAPIDPSTWYNLGNLERRTGRPDSALAAYRRAEAADSLFRPAWQMEVQTLLDHDRHDEAVATYRRWLEQLPDDHGARMSAIRLLTQLDRDAEALELARDGVRHAGEDAEAHEILGTTLAAQGRWRPAVDEIRQAEIMFRGDPQKLPVLDAVVAHLRASAPDSLRAFFVEDSIAAAARRAAWEELKKKRKAKLDANGD